MNNVSSKSSLYPVYQADHRIYNLPIQVSNTTPRSSNINVGTIVINNFYPPQSNAENTMNAVHQTAGFFINYQRIPNHQVPKPINANQNANSQITFSVVPLTNPQNFMPEKQQPSKNISFAPTITPQNFMSRMQSQTSLSTKNIYCYSCAALSSVTWRKGPYIPKDEESKALNYDESEPETKNTLCNSCGIGYLKLYQKEGYKSAANRFKRNYFGGAEAIEKTNRVAKGPISENLENETNRPPKRLRTDSTEISRQPHMFFHTFSSNRPPISSILTNSDKEANDMLNEYIRRQTTSSVTNSNSFTISSILTNTNDEEANDMLNEYTRRQTTSSEAKKIA